jgi:Bax protein
MKKACYTLLVFFLIVSCTDRKIVLQTKEVMVSSPDQILPLGDSTARPILYQNIPNFDSLTVDQSKEKFIAAVLPAILIAKYRLNQDHDKLTNLFHKENWSMEDSSFFKIQVARFNTEDSTKLLSRMLTHPNSIVLVQAAVESGWGSSRFFQEANNLFGIWSYDPNEPRIAANYSREDQQVYLRKYADISESITDYFETVGRSRAYRRFREARVKSNDVDALLPHLKYYSERREDYVAQLETIIRQNKLTQYDDFQIDPAFFIEE